MDEQMTPEEKHGVEMIQALLKLNLQTEPEAKSLANWRVMSTHDRQQTEWAYNFFVKKEQK